MANSQNLYSSECRELGYDSNSLMCSSCDELKEFKLSALTNSCKQCCIKDREEAEKPVRHKIILELADCVYITIFNVFIKALCQGSFGGMLLKVGSVPASTGGKLIF